MNPKLARLLERLTRQEQEELVTFAAFLVARRGKKLQLLLDDAPTDELTQLISDTGGFDWLDSPGEEVYSIEDGSPVQWPDRR